MRLAMAVLLILHGLAHVVGFLVPWKLAETPPGMQRTAILAGAVDLGETGARIYGLLWLLPVLCFIATAIFLLRGSPVWLGAAAASLGISAVMCAISLPQTGIGLGVNAFIAIWILVGVNLGWLPGRIS